MLLVDLGLFHRRSHTVHPREALIWTAVWVGLSLLFNLLIFFWRGPQAGMEFLTGYLIEKTLSVDNIFVFLLIFNHFAVPARYQHRVLFWGILGALLMRAGMILAGAALLHHFHWIIYVFGFFLLFTAWRMLTARDEEVDLESNWLVSRLRQRLRITPDYVDGRFWLRREGRLWVTPLLLVLLVIEATDVVFAVDSIPAIFAVTEDPFIVYSSNVFAILGMRSLFFALSGLLDRFHYLKQGLAAILGFVGIKMLISDFYKLPIMVSLLVIAAILAVAAWISLRSPPAIPQAPDPPVPVRRTRAGRPGGRTIRRRRSPA